MAYCLYLQGKRHQHLEVGGKHSDELDELLSLLGLRGFGVLPFGVSVLWNVSIWKMDLGCSGLTVEPLSTGS